MRQSVCFDSEKWDDGPRQFLATFATIASFSLPVVIVDANLTPLDRDFRRALGREIGCSSAQATAVPRALGYDFSLTGP